ncbi:MAG: VCBS repeat-containing protein [Myxococcota bacterium]
MRTEALAGVVVLLTGCGPLVSLPQESDGASADGSSGFASDEGDVGDGGEAPGTGATGLPETTVATTVDTAADGSTSGFFPDFGSSPTTGGIDECWEVTGLFTVPADSRVFAVDQNGDGLKELWVTLFIDGNGPGGSTDIFVLSPEDFPEFAENFPGFVTGFADINGDGLKDAVGFEFGGGPPRLSWMPGTGNGTLSSFVEPTTLGIEDGFLAFADLDSDGIADALRNREPPLTMLSGSGAGEFAETSVDLLGDSGPLFGDVAAFETDAFSAGVALLFETDLFEDLGACEPHNHAVYANDGENLLLQRSNGIAVDGSTVSARPLGVSPFFGDPETVFTRGCIQSLPGSESVLVHVPGFEGTLADSLIIDAELVSMGDFNGDGLADLAEGRDDTVSILVGNGDDFLPLEPSSVSLGTPVANRVYALDTDLDGRDEIIYAVEVPDNAIELRRLDYGPC